MLNEHKKAIAMKIERCMRDYGLTEDDLKIGNAGQIKGYVMGLKDALRIMETDEQPEQQQKVETKEEKEETVEDTENTTRSTSTRRRRSTQQ